MPCLPQRGCRVTVAVCNLIFGKVRYVTLCLKMYALQKKSDFVSITFKSFTALEMLEVYLQPCFSVAYVFHSGNYSLQCLLHVHRAYVL